MYYIPHGIYSARAYSKKNPEVVFNIGQDYKTKDLVDGYVAAVWSYNAREDFNPLIEQLYPDRHNHNIELRFKEEGIADWIRLIEMQDIPDYKEENTLDIGISMKHKSLNDEEIVNELERAWKVIKYIREKEVKISYIIIDYENKQLRLEQPNIETVTSSNELANWLFDYR